jgi:ribosomal protein S18 acetylase RimI-like enzyme
MKIRMANPNDAYDIAYIQVLAWKKTYARIIYSDFLESFSIKEEEMQWLGGLSNGSKVLLINYGNRVIGFSWVSILQKIRDNSFETGEINAIHLHPHFVFQGFGKKLCLASIQYLKESGCHDIVVWVIKENHTARKFYEKIGFIDTGECKCWKYFSNETVEIMLYKLSI